MHPKWKVARPRPRKYKPKASALKKSKLKLPNTYNFTRYARETVGTGLTFSLNNLVTQGSYNFTFALSRIQGFADFTALFDLFQIDKVDLYLRLIQNPDNTSSGNPPNTYYPTLWYVRDYDDEVSMTIDQMREKQGVKRVVMKPDVIKKISVKPKFQRMLYQTITSTAYGPASGYLDCVDNNTPHYGIKTIFEVPVSGASWQVEVNAKYHVSFKHPQ